MQRFYWVVCFLIGCLHASAQQKPIPYFDQYTTTHGLSHNSVTSIVQDSTGYIWAATPYGLNRFNGRDFVQFHSDDDSLSLPAEECNGLHLLQNRWLAVYSSGLHVIDTRTGTTRNVFVPYHNKLYQFKYNMIVRVQGDEQGHLYVLTRSGFYHFDCCGKLVSRFDYYREEEVPVTHYFFGRDLFELDDHRLLIVSIGGYFVYDKRTHKTKQMEPGDSKVWDDFLKEPQIRYCFFQPAKGEFFMMKLDSDTLIYTNTIRNKKTYTHAPFKMTLADFHYRSHLTNVTDTSFYITGHTAGYYKLHLDRGTGKLLLDTTKYFRNYLCSEVLKDRDGKLWVATNRGLFHQSQQQQKVQVARLPEEICNNYPDLRLDDIFISGNDMYVAARGGAGLLTFDKATMRYQSRSFFKGDNNMIRAIQSSGNNRLLLATNRQLLLYDRLRKTETPLTPASLEGSWSNDLVKDGNGNIWISSVTLNRYETVTGRFTAIPNYQKLLSIPSALAADASGNIWVAGHGVARYNVLLKQYDVVLDSFPYIKMPDKQVNTIVAEGRNRVWFNSNNNGLIGYDVAAKKFYHLTKENGLPGNNIESMYLLHGKLWMACNSIIACMDLNNFRISSFGREDGFPDMPITRNARFAYDSAQQMMYVGFETAVARFHPSDLLQQKNAPHVFVENVVVNGKRDVFLPTGEIATGWKENDIAVSIGAIDFTKDNIRFAYRIFKNDHTPWVETGNESFFSISALQPGKHELQVKAYSASGSWPEQVRGIHIIVSPPFWKRAWFIIICTALFLVLISIFIHWRTRTVRNNEMEKTQVEKLKAENYKNQLELEQISNYFSSSLADKKNEGEVLNDVAKNLIGKMNYEDCIIYTWNHNKTKMIQKAAFGPKGEPGMISRQKFDVLPGQGVVGHVIATQQPYLVADTRNEPLYRVDDAFRLSEVCVPILHNNELIGAIDSEHHAANYFTGRDIKILTTIATLIGNKLKQLESEHTLRATSRALDTINEQLAEARLSALQAQMNPHFVFNALNSIKRMILDDDNEKASRYLSKFAMMIRMTLNHSKELFVSLEENIQYLRSYLEMEQLRFDDTFQYHIDIDEQVDTVELYLPSMMIQPLVENAIWHGLMLAKGDKKIRVRFTEDNNRITCVVEDNGIGINQSMALKLRKDKQHQSVGLDNLRRRIHIMNEKYNLAASLVVTDLSEEGKTGTRATLSLNALNL